MADIPYWLIISAAFIAVASPGPATLAISSTAMNNGRRQALVLASGIWTGSLLWSASAAFGLSALMLANAWVFEIFRYLGAAYLLYLAYRSLRLAIRPAIAESESSVDRPADRSAYLRGLLLHLTNPKAVLFFGALYSVIVNPNAQAGVLLSIILVVGCTSGSILFGYALLFSIARVRAWYDRSRRLFDSLFAGFFAFAGLKIWMTRFTA